MLNWGLGNMRMYGINLTPGATIPGKSLLWTTEPHNSQAEDNIYFVDWMELDADRLQWGRMAWRDKKIPKCKA